MLSTTLLLAASMVVGQAEAKSPMKPIVYEHLKALECFVGKWESKATLPDDTPQSEKLGELSGKEVVIRSTVRWTPGMCAQIENANYNIRGVEVIKGTAIRAWDQAAKNICSHTFTSHKGTWAGVWVKVGDKWIHEFEGTDLDDKKVTGRWEITFENDDCYVIKEARSVDGEQRPEVVWTCRRIQDEDE